MILRHYGPAILQKLHLPASGVDHGLDGEGHAFLQQLTCSGAAVVKDLRGLVEAPANAVAAILANYGEALGLRVALNDVTDVPQGGPGAHGFDA